MPRPWRVQYLHGALGSLMIVAASTGTVVAANPPVPVPSVGGSTETVGPASVGKHLPAPPEDALGSAARRAYSQLPLYFEPNLGQTDDPVRFLARGPSYTLFLGLTEGVVLLGLVPPAAQRLPPPVGRHLHEVARIVPEKDPLPSEDQDPARLTAVRLRFVGANPSPNITGLEKLRGHANYFRGDDPARWRADVPTYAKVRYQGLYPGVDLICSGDQRQLQYDFVVAPEADPQAIVMGFQGVEKIELVDGDLLLAAAGGFLRLRKPRLFQELDGTRQDVSGRYVLLDADHVGFQVGEYDVTRALVIDPTLVYSTHLGGTSDEVGLDVTVDAVGNAYVTGWTTGPDFPNDPGNTNLRDSHDAFVAKLSREGSELDFSIYLGGNGEDRSHGISVDPSGSVYVIGSTDSTDFPLMNPVQATPGGGDDAFIARLSPTGSLLYSTYLGGTGDDWGLGVAADAAGNAFVTGRTESSDFPVVNPFQTVLAGGDDAFVAKLTPTGSRLRYATYLGGAGDDWGLSIAVAAGHAHVAGWTTSFDFPTQAPLQANLRGTHDAFVTRLNREGSGLDYSTYLGGGQGDGAYSITVDAAGHAYVTGFTDSNDFTLLNPAQATLSGGDDAFVLKLAPTGSRLVYATFLGGSGDDWGRGIAVDAAGRAFVTGATTSSDFPLRDPLQHASQGNYDAFVTELDPGGSDFLFSTYLGGTADDGGFGIAVDAAGSAYVTGQTGSPDLPATVRLEPLLGGMDAFVAKITETAGPTAEPAPPDQVPAAEALQLLRSAEANWENHNWRLAAERYQELVERFPTHPRAAEAHLKLATYLGFVAAPEDTLPEYYKVLEMAPGTRLALEARMGIAALDYAMGEYALARDSFLEVLNQTHDWDIVKYATYTLKELDRKIRWTQAEGRQIANCGVQSLEEVLRIRGNDTSLAETAAQVGGTGRMVSLGALARAAEAKGLEALAAKLSLEELELVEKPVIVHLRPNHFSVMTGLSSGTVQLRDAEWGDATLNYKEFEKLWTGYSLVFPRETGELPRLALLSEEETERIQGGHHLHGNNLGGPDENGPSQFHPGPSSPSGCNHAGLPTISVNLSNFNFLVQDLELSYSGRGPQVFVQRTYNADDPEEGAFGRSWIFNYEVAVEETANGSVNVKRESGKEDFFVLSGCSAGTCTYLPPIWNHDQLLKNPDGTFDLRIRRTRLTQSFNAAGRLTRIGDRNGNAVTLQYDAAGKLASVTDAVGRLTRFFYGANGKTNRVRDPAGREATYAYDGNRNLISTTDMAGNVVTYTYDQNSYMTSLTTPKGTYTIENVPYSESAFGLVVSSIMDPLGSKVSYSTPGNIIVEAVDANGNTWSYFPAGNGEVPRIVDPLGNTTEFQFNASGDRTRITDGNGHRTTLTYDSRGNITSVTDALGNKITLTYDARDNLMSLKDPVNNTYAYAYDSRDNLVRVIDPKNGSSRPTIFAYDSFGQATSLTDTRGNTTHFSYDGKGNLTSMTTPLGYLTRYAFDAIDRLTDVTTPKGDTISYSYDGIDRIRTITYPDGNIVTYAYMCCNLTGITDADSTLSFTYDAANRLTSFTDIHGNNLQYSYDATGNLTSLTYPSGKVVTYEHDEANRLLSVTDWLNNSVTYRYDAADNLVLSKTSNGLAAAYRYDDANRLISLTNLRGDGSVLTYYRYSLNALGNRTSVELHEPLSPPSPELSIAYIYDADNRLLSAGGTTFEYDENGSLIYELQGPEITTYAYDFDNRLVQIATNEIARNYQYDRFGSRTHKIENSRETRYVTSLSRPLSRLLAETDEAGAIIKYHIYGLELVSSINHLGESQFYQYDGSGNTVSVLNSDGDVLERFAYGPFGMTSEDGTTEERQPFQYVGGLGVIDEGNNVLYMRERYYSSMTGRFLSKDPLGFLAGMNQYAYVNNNPINFVDPTGLWLEDFRRRTRAIIKGLLKQVWGDLPPGQLTAPFQGRTLGERLGCILERGLKGEISTDEMARQYVLELWRTLLPIVGEPAAAEYYNRE